jgi:hypothetical protein
VKKRRTKAVFPERNSRHAKCITNYCRTDESDGEQYGDDLYIYSGYLRYKAAITYTLQFAKPGNNFVTIGTIAFPNTNTTQAVTVKSLNIAALNAGLDTLSSQALQVRLKADVGSGRHQFIQMWLH